VKELRVYIAGPIQGDESRQDYRSTLTKILLECGHTVYDPWEVEGRKNLFADVGYEVARNLMKKRLADVSSCEALLAYFPRDSVGTAIEAMHAQNLGKNVVVICPMKRPTPWIIGISRHFYRSIEEFQNDEKTVFAGA